MSRLPRPNGRSLTLMAAIVLTIIGTGQVIRAQDIEEEEEPEQSVAAPVVRFAGFNDAQFDQWVFGNIGGGTVGAARNKLDSLLMLHVEDIERSCGLTPVQKKKLLVAGHGDIKRFFDRVEELRKKFNKLKDQQNGIQQIWQEIQPLQTALNSGLFGEDSIFSKALKATLTPEQVARHEQVVHDRVLYRYWARVDLALELLNNSVGFAADQRERLRKLIAEETRPPKRLGQNDYYAVLYQISRVPEAKLKLIFDDVQWRRLGQQLAQAKGLEVWLKQQGFVPGEVLEEKRLNGEVR